MSILTTPAAAVGAESPDEENAWQRELRLAVRDADELCRRLSLPPTLAEAAVEGAREFPVFVPPAYLSRITPGDHNDPLLRQVLPLAAEGAAQPGFTADPVADEQAALHPGVLQKYVGRALLITTGACAVHCRYCFRRHFPYQEIPHSDAAWDNALQAVANDPTIEEVILSGGDPLMLVDTKLSRLAEKIAAIEHVRRLRIHTRLPVMIPARVTDELVTWLTGSRLTPIMVIHANHANELDSPTAGALDHSFAAQAELSRRLMEVGVVPYYLHQLDRVSGAAHFEVPIEDGKRIVEQMRANLPGYLVPRYVQEVPGEVSKLSIL